MPTPSGYQTNGMLVFRGQAAGVDSNGFIANMAALLRVAAKTASYTVKASESGTAFTTTGLTQAIVFTLPAVATSTGCYYTFSATAAQTMTITAPSGTLVAYNNAAATSIALSTTSKIIGGTIAVFCDGAKWISSVQVGSIAQTISVS